MIWWKATKVTGFGFLVQLVLGFFYGVFISVIGIQMDLFAEYAILFVSYVLAGFFAARRSENPYTTACLAGFLLATCNLLVTKYLFGMVFYPTVIPIGLVFTNGVACLGAFFYRLWAKYDRDESLLEGREHREYLEG
ncbi:hypothetical protein [Shimazuella kribbensis]|uniref:hypothetical protein n=1 Tax=Shimazuella kribbensis TaxID=139808 RepID=UPI00040873BF|nr:hypothetical protein [Shimazuella kribbensis]